MDSYNFHILFTSLLSPNSRRVVVYDFLQELQSMEFKIVMHGIIGFMIHLLRSKSQIFYFLARF